MRRPMRTEILPSAHPQAIAVALQLLNSGGLVAFPTDTVYGLGAPAFRPGAVARLYAVKGRPRTKAIPVLLNDAGALERVAQDIPPEAWLLAERFWPGPLTIVLARKPTV
ncbi:MAG: Sua5/YciO/YrdC/YwlC family protein, partial [Anaerolineae bacterium]|nr:Sua5/YciO/YrdC/YwlC family protein [Anaerolineae bacterium]